MRLHWIALNAVRKQVGVNHLQTDARFIVQDALIDMLIESLETMSDRIALLESKHPIEEDEGKWINQNN